MVLKRAYWVSITSSHIIAVHSDHPDRSGGNICFIANEGFQFAAGTAAGTFHGRVGEARPISLPWM